MSRETERRDIERLLTYRLGGRPMKYNRFVPFLLLVVSLGVSLSCRSDSKAPPPSRPAEPEEHSTEDSVVELRERSGYVYTPVTQISSADHPLEQANRCLQVSKLAGDDKPCSMDRARKLLNATRNVFMEECRSAQDKIARAVLPSVDSDDIHSLSYLLGVSVRIRGTDNSDLEREIADRLSDAIDKSNEEAQAREEKSNEQALSSIARECAPLGSPYFVRKYRQKNASIAEFSEGFSLLRIVAPSPSSPPEDIELARSVFDETMKHAEGRFQVEALKSLYPYEYSTELRSIVGSTDPSLRDASAMSSPASHKIKVH